MTEPDFSEYERIKHTGADADEKVTRLRPSEPFALKVRWATNLAPPDGEAYLVKEILYYTSVSIWFGPAGIGKTFLVLGILYAIAQGRSIFGRHVHQARTLYIALEGRGAIDKRVYALAKRYGECPDFGISDDAVALLNTDGGRPRINMSHVEALIAAIREHDIKIVMIDTLNLVIGGADENDNAAMGLLMAAASDIAKATGAHIGFIGHAPKAGVEGGPRGGGAQKGNADLVVSISGEGVFTASTFAPGGKTKDGAPFKLNFKLQPQDLGIDVDGDVLRSCVIEEVSDVENGAPKIKLTAELQAAFNEIVDLFATDGATISAKPRADMSTLKCLTPQQINEHWIKTARLDKEADTPASLQKKGQRLRNKLRDLGKIGLTNNYVWLISGVDNGGH